MNFDFFKMNLQKFFLCFMLVFSFISFAQEKDILFSINDKPYYTDEFTRIYKKNIDLVKDESQKDLKKYLELFIGYKLKVNKALKIGLDKNENYLTELKSNRSQLAKNYLTDSKVTQSLIDEAYSRLQKEVRASHILIMVDENAASADTLAAYNKILEIRKKAVAGDDFGKLAQDNSQDTSAKENKGDLGYFSAFRMVYAFESGAFNTTKGQVSMPIRTRFGYHLIKVNEIRPNRGEMSAAHIMISKAAEPSKEPEAKAKIDDIYKKIQQGENFAALAQQFSDDKSSSEKGGVLNKFASGQLSSDVFENVAFTLTKENPISQPFQSQYGWHIVKFIERFPVKTAQEMQQELSAKISKDERSRKITNAVNSKLKKEYPVKTDDQVLAEAQKLLTPEYFSGTWKMPESSPVYDKIILSVGSKKVLAKKYVTFLSDQQRTAKDAKVVLKTISEKSYDKFIEEQLNIFADENLENKFPEFANVVEEYKDGLLLFDLMEKEIWDKSKKDTLGLKAFFDKNKLDYKWKNRLEVSVVSSTKKEIVEKATLMLKDGKSSTEIKNALNTNKNIEVMINEGTFEEGNAALPKNVTFKTGITDIVQDKEYYFVTKVNKILPETSKSFEDAKGKTINDYQQFLEENWVSELKKEFSIKVNENVFEKVKKQIQK